MAKGRGDRKPVRRLIPFDRLEKKSEGEGTSVWEGKKGTYVFQDTGLIAERKPIRKVYLERAYLTGLFRSRKVGEYTGDLKGPEGKTYLLFRVVSPQVVEVFQKG